MERPNRRYNYCDVKMIYQRPLQYHVFSNGICSSSSAFALLLWNVLRVYQGRT